MGSLKDLTFFWGVGGLEKPICKVGLPKNGGLDSLLILEGGEVDKKNGVVLLRRGSDTPMLTMKFTC